MKFYVTTPLYYVNDLPHIGHSYTNIAADTLARYKRLRGYDVLFLTGTDEHGQKIERAAKEQGLSPQELADKVVVRFKELWKKLNISYDDFIRTTEARHKKTAQLLFKMIYEKGDIYRGKYEGWYCIPCETYIPESQLIKGNCPSCNRKPEWLAEEGYFFKLSKYQDQLLKYIDSNSDFIQPKFRRNEVVNVIKEGLKDLSITRITFDWGIKVPIGNYNDVIYVWFEALINYITGCGFGIDQEKFNHYWPADVHIVGKDILKFHAIIWPAMLISAGIIPPKKVFAHGWWTVEGKKMSKSVGNVIDPNEMISKVGVDCYRYFLLREVPFGLDGDFSEEALIHRINSDLTNDLGNLVSRTLAMIQKYADDTIPLPSSDASVLKDIALNLLPQVDSAFDNLEFNIALEHIWELVHRCNKYVDETAPWSLFKTKEDRSKLNDVLYNLAEAIRFIAIYISPFMPDAAIKIWQQLGMEKPISSFGIEGLTHWGILKPGTKINRGESIFPRIK